MIAVGALDELRRRLGRMADAAGFGPQEAPYRIAGEWLGARLRAYQGQDDSFGPVVLIVPAPIKRAYIWDLMPTVSPVRRFRSRGFRVYLLEWQSPTREMDRLGLAEYAARLPAAAVDVIEAETGVTAPLIAGNSLGGTFVSIFSTLFPERVSGLVLIEAPLAFGSNGGALAHAVRFSPHSRNIRGLVGGPIPGVLLGAMSVAAAPDVFQGERIFDLAASIVDANACALHARVERWALDELPMPGQLFEETVELLYRNDCFARGSLSIAGRPAMIAQLRAPVMAVINPFSRIVPREAVLVGLQAAPMSRFEELQYEPEPGPMMQHVGPLVGRRAHVRLWPRILDWMAAVTD